MKKIIILLCILIIACEQENTYTDAYGNFETSSVLVSSEIPGRLLFLNAVEGKEIKAGELVALVDTNQLHLQRQLINAQIGTLPQKLQNRLSEIEVLERQKLNMLREKDRIAGLFSKKAATGKQLDDISGEIEVVDQRIASIKAQTKLANQALLSEKAPLLAQKAILNDKIQKSYIFNPIDGIVLTKLAEPSEIAGVGSPLYRIANLDTITFKFYVSAVQLQQLKLGQDIEVLVDFQKDAYQSFPGQISYIAAQAEFTPKTIQTKEDRVNLVYAIEAKVPNSEGTLKIGMPAEVHFKKESN